MEIKDYVGVVARRSRFVGAVAVAAAVLALLVFLLSPTKYRAVATVVVPAPRPDVTSLIAGVSQAVDDFEGAVRSDAVSGHVSQLTGIDKGAIESGIGFTRLTTSSVAEVSYVGTDRGQTEDVAKLTSQEALSLLLTAQAAPFSQQLTLADQQYQQAEDAYRQFLSTTGILNPEEYFRVQTSRLIHLKDLLGAAKNNGETTLAARLEERIANKQTTLAQERADYDRLNSAREQALAALAVAEQQSTVADAALDSVASGEAQVSVTPAATVSRFRALVGLLVPAVVIATALAIGLVVLLEVVGPRRRRDGEPTGDAT